MASLMDRSNSLRASVKTKEEAERIAEEKGEEELDLISDPIALANAGILLTSKKNEGRVVFSLRELPLHSEWRTAAGHTVSRISRRDVLVCDNRGHPHTIDVPHENLVTVMYLPDRVLQTIWLYLTPQDFITSIPKDIGSCRLVCRAWARMIGKMVVYERTKGIKFTIPRHPQISSSDYESISDEMVDAEEGLDSATMCPISTLVRLSNHRSRMPAKGILKREGAKNTGRTKKRVRFIDLPIEEDSEKEKERRARESVRRKLAEGGDLSKRFLMSFFGWNKHDSSELSDDDSGDETEMEFHDEADHDAKIEDEEEIREQIFENQARNLNRLKELEMRLEEMIRTKSQVKDCATGVLNQPSGEIYMQDQEHVSNQSSHLNGSIGLAVTESLDSQPTHIKPAQQSEMQGQNGWAESPVYSPPSDEFSDEDQSVGAQKRRKRDSLVGILSSVSSARKRLLAR